MKQYTNRSGSDVHESTERPWAVAKGIYDFIDAKTLGETLITLALSYASPLFFGEPPKTVCASRALSRKPLSLPIVVNPVYYRS